MTLEEKLAYKSTINQIPKPSAPDWYEKYYEETTVEEKQIQTQVGETTVYLVQPKAGNTAHALLVNIHGGGFIWPHRESDTAYCRRIATEIGCVVVDIDYKLAPEYPYPHAFLECYDVTKYMAEHAAEYGIDPERIMIGGNSAGGNLSTSVCLKSLETGDFKILLYPPIDLFTDPAEKQKEGSDAVIPFERARIYNAMYVDSPEQAREIYASPILADGELLSRMPETVIFTAGLDSLRFEAEEYALKLARAGVEVTCKRWPGCKHGFYFDYTPSTFACVDAVEEKIRCVLNRKKQ